MTNATGTSTKNRLCRSRLREQSTTGEMLLSIGLCDTKQPDRILRAANHLNLKTFTKTKQRRRPPYISCTKQANPRCISSSASISLSIS